MSWRAGAPGLAGEGVQGADLLSLRALQEFPLCRRSLSQALCFWSPFFTCLCSLAVAIIRAGGLGLGAGRHCLNSEHPIPSRPVPLQPSPAQQQHCQDQAHPSPRRAALSLLQQQQAPSHEEAERRWMQQSGAERQLITLPSVSCKLRAN